MQKYSTKQRRALLDYLREHADETFSVDEISEALSAAGISLPLCIGAVCAAGLAGEVNCAFTSDNLSVGNAIGCEPAAILKIRLSYGLVFTGICLLLYLAAGFIF